MFLVIRRLLLVFSVIGRLFFVFSVIERSLVFSVIERSRNKPSNSLSRIISLIHSFSLDSSASGFNNLFSSKSI